MHSSWIPVVKYCCIALLLSWFGRASASTYSFTATNGNVTPTITVGNRSCATVLTDFTAYYWANYGNDATANTCSTDPLAIGSHVYWLPVGDWTITGIVAHCDQGSTYNATTGNCAVDETGTTQSGGNDTKLIFIAALCFASFLGFSTGFKP